MENASKIKGQIKWMNQHPSWEWLEEVVKRLHGAGFRSLLAGGCVRDELLGRIPQDLDVATDAGPDEVEALFPRHVSVGKSFGVVRVLSEATGTPCEIEVATFRKDGAYLDGRHPVAVGLKSTPKEDAERRDFTINALFWDPQKGEVTDFVGGQKDLRECLIRTVGEPQARFQEDYLRILRAFRFSCQLGFAIESKTLKAALDLSNKVVEVSRERIRDELLKILKCSHRGALPPEFESHILPLLIGEQLKIHFQLGEHSEVGKKVSENRPEWQYWLKIVSMSNPNGLKGLQNLRLSKQTMKSVAKAFSVLAQPRQFSEQRLGKQRESLRDSEILWSLSLINETWSRELISWWKNQGEQLPEPKVKASDLPGLSGQALGDQLRNEYWKQLENL